MGLFKRTYTDRETVITAENLNEIQDAILALEDGLFSVDNDKSGASITITDAAKRGFRSLNIYGKTTQSGTPTPDAPVDLISAGDSGSITVTLTSGDGKTQKATFATPNGLPGVPVDKGGNYTDANGQRWVCDEIDFFRGVYVQRVDTREIPQNAQLTIASYGTAGYYRIVISDVNTAKGNQIPFMCSHFERRYEWEQNREYTYVTGDGTSKAYLFSNRWATLSAFTAWLQEQQNNGTPLTYVYQRGEPIETPLTEEQLAAYAALYTYKDLTTVSNDAGAYMELEYVMDAKKYIDSLIGSAGGGASAGIINATVE